MPPAATPQTMPAMTPCELEPVSCSFPGCDSVDWEPVAGDGAVVDGACVEVVVIIDEVATAAAVDVSVDFAVVEGKSKSILKGKGKSVADDPVVTVLVYSVLLDDPIESHQTMY